MPDDEGVHFEVDLVHRSGPVTDGEYRRTLQLVDVATGWSERVAVLDRSQPAIAQGTPVDEWLQDVWLFS